MSPQFVPFVKWELGEQFEFFMSNPDWSPIFGDDNQRVSVVGRIKNGYKLPSKRLPCM